MKVNINSIVLALPRRLFTISGYCPSATTMNQPTNTTGITSRKGLSNKTPLKDSFKVSNLIVANILRERVSVMIGRKNKTNFPI